MESNKQPSTAETHLVASAQPLPEEPIKQQPDMPAPSANVVENNASVSTSNDTTEEIPLPKTTLEALEQRLAKYQSVQQESADNPSKYRRIGRIVKQYQDAIRLCKAGKPVPFDELPDPPGITSFRDFVFRLIIVSQVFHRSLVLLRLKAPKQINQLRKRPHRLNQIINLYQQQRLACQHKLNHR